MKEILIIAGAIALGWYLKNQSLIPGQNVVSDQLQKLQNDFSPVSSNVNPGQDTSVIYSVAPGISTPGGSTVATINQVTPAATYLLNQIANAATN